MSIHFTATLVVKVQYLDSTGDVEYESTTLESSLDLGSYRANREILHKNKDGYIESCGSMVLCYDRFLNYVQDLDTFLGKAATAYVKALKGIDQEDEDFKQWVEVTLSWG